MRQGYIDLGRSDFDSGCARRREVSSGEPGSGKVRKGKGVSDKTTTVKVKELVEALNLYPRHKVNSRHVEDLIEVLKSGVKLPAIIVEEKSMKIVDGVHRSRAYRKFFGNDYETEVILRTYESEQDFFFDAVKLNAVHGLTLAQRDRAKVVFMAARLKIPKDRICTALSITVERMDELKTQSAGPFHHDTPVGGKRKKHHRRERGDAENEAPTGRWTEPEAPRPAVDTQQVTQTAVQQLINFLRAGTIEPTPWLIGKMKELHSLMGKFISAPPPKKRE